MLGHAKTVSRSWSEATVGRYREAVLRSVSERIGGLGIDELDVCPFVLIGTVDEIAAKILRCRNQWGITYFAVRTLDGFGDVIDAVRSAE